MRTLENAIVRLLKHKPFYGHFLLNLRRSEEAVSEHPAGVTVRDGIPCISVSPARFDLLADDEQTALLEHLVKHLLHLHPLRRKGRNRHDWDICCDLAINPSIEGLPETALMPEQYGMEAGSAAEEYYDSLVPPFDFGNLEGSGSGDCARDEQGGGGSGEDILRNAAPVDDHDIWCEADSTPVSLAEEMLRSITRDSMRGSDGEVPGDIRTIVDRLMRPSPVPWRQILRQFVATAGRVGKRTTWLREHKRFQHDTPGTCKRRRLNLLVGIDVSDSTNIVALREAFAGELVQLARGREASITVLYASSRIQLVESFTSAACVPKRFDGGGFTDLRPVFDYARGMHPLPAAVIYLTDGIGPAPERMEFPTLWVLTSDGEKPVPWGVELRLTEER